MSIRIGTSGWVYPPWRGAFYPKGLAQRRELAYLSRRLNSVEINGSFYALQRPESYRHWAAEVPDDFVFSVKGGRFITHLKRLREPETALANFFASGLLALGPKLGPILWQTPANLPFDPDVVEHFLGALPRTTTEAVALAARHDARLAGRALTETDAERPLRHAMEVRHPGFKDPAFPRMLREHGVACVIADTAGTWPVFDEVTADFVYVRLHGDKELYASGYSKDSLEKWSRRVRAWAADRDVRDVMVYFDNDTKVMAPRDAMALLDRLDVTVAA